VTVIRFQLSIFAVLSSVFFCAATSHAQDFVNPKVDAPASTGKISDTNTPAEETSNGSEPITNAPVTSLENEISAEPRRFVYNFRLQVRGVYDDNINISNTNKISDFYIAIEPGISLGFGDLSDAGTNFLRLDYVPSVLLFIDHSENDAVQHLFHLDGGHQFGRLTLTLGGDIAILDGTDIGTTTDATTPGAHVNLDVGGRRREDIISARLNASYDLTGKTFLSTGFNAAITQYPGSILNDSQIISENLFINYRYGEKLTFGLGGTAGYDFVSAPNPNQTFEQANVRASYVLTGKIDINASGGIEFRQFENNSRGQYVSPVFDLSVTYQPTDAMSFTLSGNRRTYNSGEFSGQDFSGTTITATLRQRFLQRFYLGLAGGYQNSDYFSAVKGVHPSRRDDYYFIEPTLDFNVTRFWTVGAYYLHRQNDSSDMIFAFDDNQIGFRTGFTF
jgi:hypothetical protein